MTGKTISHYRILERIGSGGMGVVYKAEDLKLGRPVALKFLPEDLAQDRQALERLQREARAASSLNHPNICTIYDIEESEGRHFIAMELLEGKTLKEEMNGRALPSARLVELATQIADALDAAHRKSIVHRDLKPGNLFVTDRGQAKILDFGLAKVSPAESAGASGATTLASAKQHLTNPGVAIGTAAYMSPEQARGEELDPRSDLFSFGAVLYEMATGREAFAGNTSAVTFHAILERHPAMPSTLNPGVPEELSRIIGKALEKDRDLRYQSAAELRSDLLRLRRESVTGQQLAASKPARRAKLWFSLAVAALLAVIAAGVTVYRGMGRAPISSVAVLPFTNTGGNADLEFLSDGLTEELINNLTQVPLLKVIARPTAFTYKGRQVTPQAVGKELAVRAVVMGRLVQRGDQITLQVDLVNADDGSQIWGHQFQRPAGQIQAIPAEIVPLIADNLRVKLSEEQAGRLARASAANPEAYQLYLRGRFSLADEKIPQAVEYFQQAVQKDPGYAAGWAGLADAIAYESLSDEMEPKLIMPKAREAALKALQLDSSSAEAHTSLGIILMNYDWDWAGAEREFRKAQELNPGYVFGRHWYSHYLELTGHLEQAVAEMKQIVELDPLSPMYTGDLVNQYHSLRRPEQILSLAQKMVNGNESFGYVVQALAYQQMGKRQEALSALEQIKSPPTVFFERAYFAGISARLGRTEEARKILAELNAKLGQGYVPAFYQASLYFSLGDKERGFQYLEKAAEQRSGQLPFFLGPNPEADDLRSDPRFQALARKVGLPGAPH